MAIPDRILADLNVSRETSERLKQLADMLIKWNPRINLVSKSTIADLWTRHILDSAQVLKIAPPTTSHWVDIGSGGGFPGLVIALMCAEPEAPQKVTLIESDQRKCAFLRSVLRETGVPATVISQRIEQTEPQKASVLSARALADLNMLFGFAERHLSTGGLALFPKGATWEKEIADAKESWSFQVDAIQSITEPQAVILKVGELNRV
ncbi:16S rRNA (guanine527-N7)-methyltransferase [Shimia isoporae]|uniref:Ribosomal RNA small subunit methyltransferase G n=1 Tax=Shimia isoporae TaxID=647720 RepID=A0A4R1N1A6_9RHOB|nr:16S rRNA (guanine(527)-N(7))-methyltransferase RsmG [Shimia isoporae]TCK99817.1 16S rRNA (guanine527-N7)-methyltransferase [Shimia isoporae]